MNLRVTLQTFVNQALAETALQTSQLSTLQAQAATGSRLQAPSDDPFAAATVEAGTTQTNRLQSYLSNIDDVTGTLNASVSALQDVSSIFNQAQSIALQASQSTNGATADNALADQVDQLLKQLLADANTQSNGEYLFSGATTQTRPFVVTQSDALGNPGQVTYQGAAHTIAASVAQDQVVGPYLSGQEVFQSIDRQPPVYTGTTDASVGTGTDSAVGQQTLIVRHDNTTYAAGSGVAPGTSSASGDTIIGPPGANQLTIDAVNGTISLNGGTPVAYTNSDTNLRVAGPNGAVVYVDTTGIAPGFQGTVDITANGSMSIDGATYTPIDFSTNQQLADSTTGAVVNVNSTNIRSTGTDTINHPGTYDAFQTLMALRDTLRSTTLSSHDQALAISNLVGEIERVNGGINDAAGKQSAVLQHLSQLKTNLQDMKLSTQQLITNVGSADLSQVVVQLQAQQTMLQLSLYGFAQMLNESLLQFLK
jgi:flagellar hook-associated protein 3